MPKKVLVVDDVIFTRTTTRDILEKNGFMVVGEASNGLEAVEKFVDLKPDIVTLDVIMPGMDGVQAVREIIKRDSLAKVIMCTAEGQEELVEQAIRYGASAYICKPIKEYLLLKILKKIVQ